MIAINNEQEDHRAGWQTNFIALLPDVESQLRLAFRHLSADAREDAVAEAIVHSVLSYCRLHHQGRAEAASATTLAWYAALAVKRGRPAGNRMNGKEPLSRYAQVGNGIQVKQLGRWMGQLVDDQRASVPDIVAAKLDVGAWLTTLSHRMRLIASDLAYGFTTSEIAAKYGVTSGRISQMRRALEASWTAFQRETKPVLAQ